MEDFEIIIFQMITNTGSAKSKYIEAVQCAKAGDYEGAEALIKEGTDMMIKGHQIHADLVQKEAAGESIQMSLILAHAEDQMMSAEVFKIMGEELIELYKKIEG